MNLRDTIRYVFQHNWLLLIGLLLLLSITNKFIPTSAPEPARQVSDWDWSLYKSTPSSEKQKPKIKAESKTERRANDEQFLKELQSYKPKELKRPERLGGWDSSLSAPTNAVSKQVEHPLPPAASPVPAATPETVASSIPTNAAPEANTLASPQQSSSDAAIATAPSNAMNVIPSSATIDPPPQPPPAPQPAPPINVLKAAPPFTKASHVITPKQVKDVLGQDLSDVWLSGTFRCFDGSPSIPKQLSCREVGMATRNALNGLLGNKDDLQANTVVALGWYFPEKEHPEFLAIKSGTVFIISPEHPAKLVKCKTITGGVGVLAMLTAPPTIQKDE